MSFPARFNERREEYDNFQRTNLEDDPRSYEDWMFGRRIKDKLDINAPFSEKVSKFATTSFNKFLVAVSLGDKEKAKSLKLTLLSNALSISFNLQELSKNKMIQRIAVTIIFCLRVCSFIRDYNNPLNITSNQTNF